MPDAVVVLPPGCVPDDARVMCYARTRAEFDKVVQYAKDNGRWVTESDERAPHRYIVWHNQETNVDYHVSCPTVEQEEEFDHENLAARYRGKRP